MEAFEIVNTIHRLKKGRRLEDEPSGGDLLKAGDEPLGSALNCPLWIDKAWEAVRIKEMALIQSAHRLAKGEMWLPTQMNALQIPICSVAEIAQIGVQRIEIFTKRVNEGRLTWKKVTRIRISTQAYGM